MQLSLSSAETCITKPCDHLVYVVGFRVISALEITIPHENTFAIFYNFISLLT